MNVVLAGHNIAIDEDGYLLDYKDWTPDIARALAQQQAVTLNEAHWEIINAIRDFYNQYQRSPTTRVLLKYLTQQLGTQKGSSIYVMQLFGSGTPAKSIAKLAGLPKPPNCI
ncbi:MAG: TusE/DsrC/DsvC family sulfur relay protein [Moraxellaceae bacterium]|nr:TusE/DsrC/DsvC family sulfur relay protein [Pseudomonadales bacterium]MCB1673964.1 TusE/DsrC/DsvC family sulfur relay protein [Pseudomonadales bacterium]MCP5174104.1 TusE/DsrC/DsvC family sulfur relay protein [Moraxellaceae bacterium]MCP5176310.1 TusE/DsrC/DsvC family sulfur relay protein [Moraxellaceae bacterium]HQV21775.1 TusE/DsrC/DsvC family sulfur relay protein [Agitococcus sp.]